MNVSKTMKKWIIFSVMTALCSVAVATLYAMKPVEETMERKVLQLKPVSIQNASPGVYPIQVKAYGEVLAKWTTIIKTQVGGRITRINENLQPGQQFKAGEIILELEQINYQTALGQARLELENARVNLIQVERQASQARADWKGSGIKQPPASPLVFHEPQLKAAKAQLSYAKKVVEKAENDLKQTRITAPYDGLVVERFVNKGETVFTGDRIVKLVSIDQIEIGVNLDAIQVHQIGQWKGNLVQIIDPGTGRTWMGKLIRDKGIMDRETRLRRFYIVPLPCENQICPEKLVPGMFVTAVIQGKNRDNLFALTESCLTRDGDIWFLDEKDRLRRQKAVPVFYQNGQVYIENITNTPLLRVVMTPGSGLVAGTRVAPVSREEG